MTYPPNPNRLGRLFAFTLALAASALLLHCNTQPAIENTLTLTLNDSLSAQANKYDSLVIQMVDSLGRPLRDTLFSEPYDLPQDKQKLKDMPLGQAPNPLYVQVRAYYQGALALTLTFVWKDGVQSVKETRTVDIADAAGPGLDTLPLPDPDSTSLPPEVKPPIPGAPSVNITSPSKDTSVNRSPLTLRYSVDAVSAESSVVLKDGPNAIRVLRGNAQGQIGGDSVIVTFDTVAPKVVISSPSESTWTRLSSLPVVWSVDDQAATAKTTEALQGEGLKTIIRESMDPAGNVGSDTVLVIRDTTAPRIIFDEPIAGYQTNADSILVKWRIVDDKGKPLSQSKQDWQKLTDTGSITLTRKGSDLAGNEGMGSVVIHRRLTGLRVNILSPKPMQGTRFDTITVKWEVDGKAQPGLVASLTKEDQNTITVDTVDAFGNKSSAFVIVVRDQVPPGIPILSRNAALSNAPSWAWKPNAGMGGAKVYRWRMNTGGAAGTWSLETKDSSYTPGSVIPQGTDADYVLEVQERDSVGNWSEAAASTITVDKKAPSLSLTSDTSAAALVTNLNPVFSGLADDSNGIKSVECQVGNGAMVLADLNGKNWSCAPELADGDIVVTLRAMDKAGNSTEAKITVHKRSKVVFVRKGSVGGDGSSWKKAWGELWPLLLEDSIHSIGTTIWVSKGTFDHPDTVYTLHGHQDLAIWGGFSNSGGPLEKDRNLVLYETNLSIPFGMTIGTQDKPANKFELNGLTLRGDLAGVYVNHSSDVLITNCLFSGFRKDIPLLVRNESIVIVTGSTFNGNHTGTYGAILVGWGGTMKMTGSTVTNNTSAYSSFAGGLTIGSEGSAEIISSRFENNRLTPENDEVLLNSVINIHVMSGGRLSQSSNTIVEGAASVRGEGTITPPF